jgi:hypothetical protein
MKPIPPAREALEETEDVRYMEPNRDRVVGGGDRTGRHFDAELTTEEPQGEPERGKG